ncbi:hypothetical protein GQ55_2G148700 [Panicum hallii var. hallii]|uniref:Uncharacterized protein n=1 Tax=Panicum hallii var. hallii TaxID=1504633 RepID=A0A2T7EPU0_9POAL|nr:hypothetical protein GQ55_2G148700 [Panicum hallii var. hallii]
MPPPPPVNPQRLSPTESRTLHFYHGMGVNVPLPASAERHWQCFRGEHPLPQISGEVSESSEQEVKNWTGILQV